MKIPNYVLAMRVAAYVTALGVGLSFYFSAPKNLALTLGLVAVFTIGLPMYPRVFHKTVAWYLASLLFEAALAVIIMVVSNQPGTGLVLFLILMPHCPRLPRPLNIVCYILFALLACGVFYLRYPTQTGWSSLFTILPGFMALTAMGEGFWKLRIAQQENRQLIDSLIAAQKILSANQERPAALKPGNLTQREGEVLALVAKGYSNREIAERLFIAEGTVKNRVSQILDKIQVRDRTQAALRARELGIL